VSLADLADLRGARFITTSETEEGQRLAEGKLKLKWHQFLSPVSLGSPAEGKRGEGGSDGREPGDRNAAADAASNQAGLRPGTTIGNELSGPRSEMNNMSQQKQTKCVVEHKGVYPRLGSEAVIRLQAQSLAWDILCAVGSRISLVAAHLQLIQQLAWDTLSNTKISDNFAGILITFWLVCAIGPLGRPSQDILRIPQKFLLRTVADLLSKKSCPEAASWWLTR
jgi:hypothetical protein